LPTAKHRAHAPHTTRHAAGKPNGQAFVLLPKAEAARAQQELHNKYMGKRFIE
jgi:hypothetical protein